MNGLHKDFIVYLGDGNELTFPSIGSLTINSTVLNDDTDYQLDFSIQNPHNYLNQLQYFSSKWNKSEIEINRFFLRLSDAILASCTNKGKFELPQIGSFDLVDNKVYFHSSYEIEQTLTKYFAFKQYIEEPAIIQSKKIEPVKEIKEVASEMVYVSRPKYFRQIAAILLLVIVAFSGLYVYDSFFDSYKFPANFKFEDSGYKESDFNKSPGVIDFPLEDNNPNKETLDIDTQLMNDLIDAKEDVMKSSNDILNQKKEDALLSDDTNSCTYILGSFGSLKNVKNLEDKLFDMGENPTRIKSDNLTRVGVSIPCGSQEKIARLLEIESNMWLLEE